MSRVLVSDLELEGETLEAPELDGELSTATLVDCVIRNAVWTEGVLRKCLFEGCIFEGCDLTMMSPYDTSFRDTRFERCKLMGVDWTKAHQLTFDARFHGCVMSYATFESMALRELSMTECKAIETVFTEADLTGADLAGTDLEGAVFLHTVLHDADLSLALNATVDPTTNRLRDTRLALDAALRCLEILGVRVP